MIGIGIDTGGTYTDAVLYDFNENEIIYSAKALTTKEDLSKGIDEVLDQLPQDVLKSVDLISLSTTLATNACVEGKGGRGKLILIGADKNVIDRNGRSYGLPDSNEIYFLDGEVDYNGNTVREPDWTFFVEDVHDWMKDAEAIAVVQQFGIRNKTAEEKTKEIIAKQYGINTVCGHELFSDLNYIKRASSTLLNAKLIPVIQEFLEAIKTSLQKRNMDTSVVIVCSDGSHMSEEFTSVRPVETLLSGPAASVMGGTKLTGQKDCIIVDMGGTTTDLALVKDGIPVTAHNGVKVGKWQTFVKAVYIDTFGLGGDSGITVNKKGEIILGTNRIMPLSIAGKRWPQITDKLERLNTFGTISDEPLHEFLCLTKSNPKVNTFTADELKLCEALNKGPLSYSEVKRLFEKRSQLIPLRRLETEGIVMRCGITPTDIMHIKGDYNEYAKEATILGVSYLNRFYNHKNSDRNKSEQTMEDFCDEVYNLVKGQLYYNIVRMLLESKYEKYKTEGIDETMDDMIKDSWKAYQNDGKNLFHLQFTLSPTSLVGVGAPIHLFLPDVAKALGTECYIPEKAGVANALGAIVGNVRAIHDVYVKDDDEGGYIVFCQSGNKHTEDYDEAIQLAITEAKNEALKEAKRRGALGEIEVTVHVDDRFFKLNSIFRSTTVRGIAVGSIVYNH